MKKFLYWKSAISVQLLFLQKETTIAIDYSNEKRLALLRLIPNYMSAYEVETTIFEGYRAKKILKYFETRNKQMQSL